MKIISVLEKRKNIKINLKYMISCKNDNCRNLIKELDDMKSKIKLKEKLINEYIKNEQELKYEIEKLQSQNTQLLTIGKEQYKKAIIDLVKILNDSTNGNLLDRLYCYLKYGDEKILPFIVSNLLNVLRQVEVYPRETIKIREVVSIGEYSFYNYRINKDISDIELCEGKIVYPAWFYNDKETLKPYVNIKGE